MSRSLRLLLAVALGLAGGGAIAQSQTQKAAMGLGVARSGVVQSIDVADGAHVAAGQVLAELDCKALRKEIDVRAASLEAAEATCQRIVNGPRPEEIAIG